MTDTTTHAQRLRICADLLDAYPTVIHDVLTYPTGDFIHVHTVTDDSVASLGLELGSDVITVSTTALKSWVTVDGATFQGVGVHISGPHRDRRPLDPAMSVEDMVA